MTEPLVKAGSNHPQHCYDCVGTLPRWRALRMPINDPDVLLLDINLPGMLGSEGVKLFREKYPACRF